MSLEIQFKQIFLTELNLIASSKERQGKAIKLHASLIQDQDYVREEGAQYGLNVYAQDIQAHLLACILEAYEKTLKSLSKPSNSIQFETIFKETVKPMLPALVSKPDVYIEDEEERTPEETTFHYLKLNTEKTKKDIPPPSLFNLATNFFRQNKDEITVGFGLTVLATATAATILKKV